jgi:acyl-CoA thioester hydrolase
MAHQVAVKVRFYELDPYNHVNHSAYIQYFEVARIELLEEVGFGLATLQELGRHIVVTGLTTRFLRPARAGDELTVETEVGEIRRATSRWHQRILRGDEVLATQVVDAAMTDVGGRPARFLPELAAALGPHLADGE